MYGTERILVVEDDPQVAEIICWNLFAAGYAATLVADGLDALRTFDEEHPALVTLDLLIPTVSGFRLVELFKRERPQTPILVVTALTFEEAEEAARSGADDFITKPFDPRTLVQKIDYHLRRLRLPAAVSAVSGGEPEQWDATAERRRDFAVR
jgi:DNA-binding response OmpR family regulator